MMDNNDNKIKIAEESLAAVSGGTGSGDMTYQLYYRGNKLPMNDQVSQICKIYPEARNIFYRLGLLYSRYAHMTLNQLCEDYGERKIQMLIYENS